MNQPIQTPPSESEQPERLPGLQAARPVRIQMLGESRVGKTCFVAGLAMLNEQSDGRRFVLPTDTATKATFDKLRATLSEGRWPAKTSIVDQLSFAVVHGSSRVNVLLSDFAGESFSDAMTRGNTNEAADHVKSLVSSADLLLVLLDGAAVDRDTQFAGAPLIQAVFERISSAGAGDLDAAVVLTKSDLCVNTPMQTGDDLKHVVEDRVPDLARFLKEQHIQTQWIPVSACGPDATDDSGMPIYESLAPQGYEALFDQLYRRSRRPRNHMLRAVAAAIVLLTILAFSWISFREHEVGEEGEQIAKGPPTQVGGNIDPRNEPLLKQKYEDEFKQVQDAIQVSGNVESVNLALKPYENIPTEHKRLVAGGLKQLRETASARKEQLLYKSVDDCQRLRTGDCVVLIGKYLSEFPDGEYADELLKMLEDKIKARYQTACGHVKAIPVASTDGLKQKAKAITAFLGDYQQFLTPDEKAAITSARDIANDFLVSQPYHCKLIRTSGMDTPRDHGVEIYVNGDRIANYDDSGDVVEKNWNQDFVITWHSGQSIGITLVNYDARDQDMAYFDNSTPVAIVLLAATRSPSRYATTAKFFGTDFTKTRPDFKVVLTCKELPPEKLQIISNYLLPGDKW